MTQISFESLKNYVTATQGRQESTAVLQLNNQGTFQVSDTDRRYAFTRSDKDKHLNNATRTAVLNALTQAGLDMAKLSPEMIDTNKSFTLSKAPYTSAQMQYSQDDGKFEAVEKSYYFNQEAYENDADAIISQHQDIVNHLLDTAKATLGLDPSTVQLAEKPKMSKKESNLLFDEINVRLVEFAKRLDKTDNQRVANNILGAFMDTLKQPDADKALADLPKTLASLVEKDYSDDNNRVTAKKTLDFCAYELDLKIPDLSLKDQLAVERNVKSFQRSLKNTMVNVDNINHMSSSVMDILSNMQKSLQDAKKENPVGIPPCGKELARQYLDLKQLIANKEHINKGQHGDRLEKYEQERPGKGKQYESKCDAMAKSLIDFLDKQLKALYPQDLTDVEIERNKEVAKRDDGPQVDDHGANSIKDEKPVENINKTAQELAEEQQRFEDELSVFKINN